MKNKKHLKNIVQSTSLLAVLILGLSLSLSFAEEGDNTNGGDNQGYMDPVTDPDAVGDGATSGSSSYTGTGTEGNNEPVNIGTQSQSSGDDNNSGTTGTGEGDTNNNSGGDSGLINIGTQPQPQSSGDDNNSGTTGTGEGDTGGTSGDNTNSSNTGTDGTTTGGDTTSGDTNNDGYVAPNSNLADLLSDPNIGTPVVNNTNSSQLSGNTNVSGTSSSQEYVEQMSGSTTTTTTHETTTEEVVEESSSASASASGNGLDCTVFNTLDDEAKTTFIAENPDYASCSEDGSAVNIDANQPGAVAGQYTWPGLDWIESGKPILTEHIRNSFGFLRTDGLLLRAKEIEEYKAAQESILTAVKDIDQLRAQLGPQCEFDVETIDCNKEYTYPCKCGKSGCSLCYDSGAGLGRAGQLVVKCNVVKNFDAEKPDETVEVIREEMFRGPLGNCEFKDGVQLQGVTVNQEAQAEIKETESVMESGTEISPQ